MKPIHGIFPESFIGKITAFLQSLKSGVYRLVTRRKRGGEIFYIGTAGKLPETLTGDEEAAYLADMENPLKREQARQALIEHNLRLVVYIARKYENSVTDGVGMEDFISVGTIGLMKAVETFHCERGIKLATYASRCIENEILMLLRKNAGRHEVSMDEPLSTDWDGNELLLSDVLSDEEDNISKNMEYAEEKKSIQEALSRLSEREQVIIRLRYGLGGSPELTQKEVADKMGISQSYISRLEKKILRRLGSELNGKI